jgi:THO complex subunit 2
MSIAGYFDLDPTRLLDIILDAFSTHVMTHFSFFIHLIRHFVGTRARLLPKSQGESMLIDNDQSSTESEFERHLAAAEGANPTILSHDQLENPVAHLIGFKFAHYEVRHHSVGFVSVNSYLSTDNSQIVRMSHKASCLQLRF